MRWKVFGLRGRLSSPKDKVFSLIRAIGKSNLNASSDANEKLTQHNNFTPQTYITARQRMHEIEGQKAMVMHELRHDFWKAGGSV